LEIQANKVGILVTLDEESNITSERCFFDDKQIEEREFYPSQALKLLTTY